MPSANATQPTQGWTSQPNGRGTFDILQSSLLTIFLCCWTSICPNIPSKRASRLRRLLYKVNLAGLALLGPEFVLVLALGQYASARRSRKKFREAGYTNWSLKHAFFADMGGFMLRSPGWPDLPLDAAQVFYLVDKKYVPYPEVSKEDIDDKNKSDSLARVLTVLQGAWFLVNSIARPIQKLTLTTLELTTLSFIFVMLATSFFWRHKPQDIQLPIALHTETHIFKIIADANAYPTKGSDSYRWTPLEFISREEWPLSKFWYYYKRLAHKLLGVCITIPPKQRPYDYIPNDNFLNTDSLVLENMGAWLVMGYSATFTTGWNLFFPTEIERILWRVSSLFNLGFGAVGGSIIWYWLRLHKPSNDRQDLNRIAITTDKKRVSSWLKAIHQTASSFRNISPTRDPQLDVPLRFLIPMTLLCAIYCLFRAYILLEDFIGLRRLPASAYDSVDWSIYFPHF